jgi:hypothetical protein
MRSVRWHRRSTGLAVALATAGLIAVVGATLLDSARTVLITVGGIFLFAAILVRFLPPERRVRAAIGEGVYTDLVANEAALVEAYGLQDTQVYIPRNGASGSTTDDPPAWLFVPRHASYGLPEENELGSLLVASDIEWRRGLSFRPTGGGLFDQFTSMLDGETSDSPAELAEQLADRLIEGLELADRVVPDVRSTQQRVAFEIANSAYGPVDRFDHPVQSFLAIGFAKGLDCPILAETTTADDSRFDYVVTCRWETIDPADDGERTRGSRSAPLWPGRWEPKHESGNGESDDRSK